jgi:hypothetical protein
VNVLPRPVGLEKEQLRDDPVRDVIIELGAEEDDPVAEQPRKDVVAALTAARASADLWEMTDGMGGSSSSS